MAHPTKILGGPWPTRPTLQRPHGQTSVFLPFRRYLVDYLTLPYVIDWFVADASVSSVDLEQPPYLMKCATDNVGQLDIDSPDGATHHHHHDPDDLNQQSSITVASTVPAVPSSIAAVVTGQSLTLQNTVPAIPSNTAVVTSQSLTLQDTVPTIPSNMALVTSRSLTLHDTVPAIPPNIAVVTSQSLTLQDPSIFYPRCDTVAAAAAAAAAGRNIAPVKCTSSHIFLIVIPHLEMRVCDWSKSRHVTVNKSR